ncbi:ABC transporter ATP-binding protein [Nocardia sp. AG03]|uniref:ABC transporter ATP-binding protein n=1 Tax=Nocardia sp. AG03 TaxID=3025312 RepID=UPI0024187821|nr:ABC transporter ATP-binding protein [Nocardia sp. AG03]
MRATPTTPARPALIGLGAAGRMLRPVRRNLVACAVFSAVGEAAGLAPYVALAEIARALFDTPAPRVDSTVWAWVAVGAVGALVRVVLLGLSVHVGHHADARMLHHLRVRIAGHLSVLPLGWFRAAGSAQVKKAMTDDLEDMHHLFAHSLGEILGAASALVVAAVYLLAVDVPMGLITLAVPLAALLGYRFSMRSMPGHMARLIAAERQVSVSAVEYGDGIAVAKTFGAGGRVLDRFTGAVEEQRAAFRVWVDEIRYSSALYRVLGSEVTAAAVVLAAGLAFVHAGRLPVIDLVPFLVVGIGLPTSSIPMLHGSIGLRTARMAAGHIDSLLATPGLPIPVSADVPRDAGIVLEKVSFSYGGTCEALVDIDLVCPPGSVTALVGPSGAGKSTLAALLARFHDVDSGAVRVGGVDVRAMSSRTLLSSLALVFQDVVLLRDTVTENIRIGRPEATDEQVRAAARAARVDEVIRRLPDGYDTVLDTAGVGLSGGERQRLTIARAICADAPIVVLDEATAALDPDSETAVQRALAELTAGRTVLVIAHRLHTIAAADQIVVLDGGRLVEQGTFATLTARDGLFARMWRAQRPRSL